MTMRFKGNFLNCETLKIIPIPLAPFLADPFLIASSNNTRQKTKLCLEVTKMKTQNVRRLRLEAPVAQWSSLLGSSPTRGDFFFFFPFKEIFRMYFQINFYFFH